MATRVFGDVPGVPPGTTFASRKDVAASGVHRPQQAGISGSAQEGAYSIVVSGGYEDDKDFGDVILYTGAGGNEGKRQVADQAFTGTNRALAVSADRGLPVRVVRGAGGDPQYSPALGYRYDGLFSVEWYGLAPGKSGFTICQYRLVQEPAANALAPSPPPAPTRGRKRTHSNVQRLIRNTAITVWVKQLYDFTCQICQLQLQTAAGPYAEGAHIRPLGTPHHGPDTAENVLCLCPNDHVRLDRGAIVLDPAWNVIDQATGNGLGALHIDPSHPLDPAHALYHRKLFS